MTTPQVHINDKNITGPDGLGPQRVVTFRMGGALRLVSHRDDDVTVKLPFGVFETSSGEPLDSPFNLPGRAIHEIRVKPHFNRLLALFSITVTRTGSTNEELSGGFAVARPIINVNTTSLERATGSPSFPNRDYDINPDSLVTLHNGETLCLQSNRRDNVTVRLPPGVFEKRRTDGGFEPVDSPLELRLQDRLYLKVKRDVGVGQYELFVERTGSEVGVSDVLMGKICVTQ